MSERVRKILDVSKMAQGEKEIVIWTSAFKVKGKLYTEMDKLEEGVVTLTDAIVCRHFEDCQCEENSHYYKWVNVFEDQVIGFSVIH